jgi:hypothetical protein
MFVMRAMVHQTLHVLINVLQMSTLILVRCALASPAVGLQDIAQFLQQIRH